MKLYISGKGEVDALKQALRNAKTSDPEVRAKQMKILERVILCEQLQDNIDRADVHN